MKCLPEQAARERYEDIAKQIEREDGLVNTRTTWLMVSETLLFGGVGVLATKAADLQTGARPYSVFLLLLGCSFLFALATKLAGKRYAAIHAAIDQLKYLQGKWDESNLRLTYVRPFGGRTQHEHGFEFPLKLAELFKWCAAAGTLTFWSLAVVSLESVTVGAKVTFVIGLALGTIFGVGWVLTGEPKNVPRASKNDNFPPPRGSCEAPRAIGTISAVAAPHTPDRRRRWRRPRSCCSRMVST